MESTESGCSYHVNEIESNVMSRNRARRAPRPQTPMDALPAPGTSLDLENWPPFTPEAKGFTIVTI
jgi:hypothetical protein